MLNPKGALDVKSEGFPRGGRIPISPGMSSSIPRWREGVAYANTSTRLSPVFQGWTDPDFAGGDAALSLSPTALNRKGALDVKPEKGATC